MWRDDRAVATTEGDIAEVLEAETLVDMQKLRELSTHGIPNNLRAEAWKYLLGVARPEKDEEMSLHRQNIEEYRELEILYDGKLSEILDGRYQETAATSSSTDHAPAPASLDGFIGLDDDFAQEL